MNLKDHLKIGREVLMTKIKPGYRIPLSVHFFLTYRCPYRCLYCNIKNDNDNKADLPLNKVLGLIDQMALAGTRRLHLTGGEPMLREDIEEIINFAKHKGMFVGLSSSGYQISDRIKTVKNVDIVFLSFDGERKVQEYLRGEGSYDVLRAAIDSLKRAGIKFWTTTVLHRMSVSCIDFILESARVNDFIANFQVLHSRNDDYRSCFRNEEDINDLLMKPQEVKEAISCLIEKKKKGERVGNSQAYLELILNWENYPQMYQRIEKKRCWAGKLYCYLEPDGMLYPCGTLLEKVIGKDAIDLGFLKAFEQLPDIPCNLCLSGCQMEQNFIFSLNWNSVMNWLGLLSR